MKPEFDSQMDVLIVLNRNQSPATTKQPRDKSGGFLFLAADILAESHKRENGSAKSAPHLRNKPTRRIFRAVRAREGVGKNTTIIMPIIADRWRRHTKHSTMTIKMIG